MLRKAPFNLKNTTNAPANKQRRLFFREFHNVIRCALQNRAQFFKGVHRDGFVAFQIGDGICAEAFFVNQRVGSYTLFFHGFPQRFIANHARTSPFDRFFILSPEKFILNISKFLPIMCLSKQTEGVAVGKAEKSTNTNELATLRQELLFLRALKLRAIARYQRQIEEIDRKLLAIEQRTAKP